MKVRKPKCRIYEIENIHYDKYYEIQWDVEFIDVRGVVNPGDPTRRNRVLIHVFREHIFGTLARMLTTI